MNKKEVFLVEYQRKIALFAPLKGVILEINKDEKRKIVELLESPGFSFDDLLRMFPEIKKDRLLVRKTENELIKERAEKFCPISTVLFTTFNCHLRCIYCYANAGEQKLDVVGEQRVNMNWEIAKAAINLVIENAKSEGSKECSLEFHGGGEPTWNWSIFKLSLEYFNEQAQRSGLVPKVNLVTNGMLSKKQIEWIIDHQLQAIQVSLDGMEEIHNFQRPTAKGGESFATVYRTINSFLAKGAEVVIHSVVTEKGITQIPEIVNFFGENFPGTIVQIEPASPCGRGLIKGQKFPSADLFIKGFIEAQDTAKLFDIELIYSGASSRLAEVYNNFCGVSEPNFVVTPSGLVTACHEVASFDNPLAEFFIYGRWDRRNKRFDFDHQKIKRLQNYTTKSDSICFECFAGFYCAGDCLAKRLNDKDERALSVVSQRCKINRELMKYYIFNRLFGSKGGAL